MTAADDDTLSARRRRGAALRRLTAAGPLFVMPNAWDAGSARLLAAQGFPAIGTTSAGIAYALGRPDQSLAVPRDTMLAHCAAIAAAVPLPVSGDLEDGYGAAPAEVAATVTAALAAGLVGGNIEDVAGDPDADLYDRDLACDRIRAARAAADADASGVPFTLTARTDALLRHGPQALDEAIERAIAYRDAGADCLFAPGLADADSIGRFVRAVDAPVTVVMGFTGPPLDTATLAALGVTRVTTGGSLARACFGLLRRAAEELAGPGTFGYAAQQIPDAELTAFFRRSDD